MKIFLAGDSIVQDYTQEEFIAGWGQYLPKFLKKDVEVVNCAKGGRSSRLFINEEHSKAPLRTEISPEHPYFTIFDYSEHRYGAPYELLPEDLKPYAAIEQIRIFRMQDPPVTIRLFAKLRAIFRLRKTEI